MQGIKKEARGEERSQKEKHTTGARAVNFQIARCSDPERVRKSFNQSAVANESFYARGEL